ncbi:uncharacterized protein L203_104919 [Cryptococcus depauperatus CBS 7841]|uniref:Uncharacterized protein n=1 Tax=Cryptococcus depauperatus CBS 7841 TaxID=1295531 RepID=A0A1E3IMX4_9TREE|nr:hypothetical protein L203_01870 [Cryptococcus depauperatus CBS 7841]ODN96092.1 hypothetical protein L204_03783 [Cryptococcus depauperatus CBS 7855]
MPSDPNQQSSVADEPELPDTQPADDSQSHNPRRSEYNLPPPSEPNPGNTSFASHRSEQGSRNDELPRPGQPSFQSANSANSANSRYERITVPVNGVLSLHGVSVGGRSILGFTEVADDDVEELMQQLSTTGQGEPSSDIRWGYYRRE